MATTLGIVRPSKKRDIEGVSASSVVNLKATLFQAQEEAKRTKLGGAGGRDPIRKQLVIKKNAGIEARMLKDEQEAAKRLDPTEELSKKMARYEDMVQRGEIDQGERFLVDFEMKSWQKGPEENCHAPDQMAFSQPQDEGAIVAAKRLEQHMILSELGEQTRRERERVQDLKAQRQQAAQKRLALKKEQQRLKDRAAASAAKKGKEVLKKAREERKQPATVDPEDPSLLMPPPPPGVDD
mmetsp:Transcript_18993/g.44509  ORF Transcript_18993/g.44509 Transcript_18993/m.44509 type:complete len:239 (-) Transcript_18993:273-989(-)